MSRLAFDDEEPIGVIQDATAIRPVRVIARGGMGIVYEADLIGCEGFSKRVAVKMIRRRWGDNQRFVKLLVAEAKLVSDLVHENIAQMYLLGTDPDGRHYVVMEHVAGLSLYDLMVRHWEVQRRMPQPLAIHIVSRIARGLAYAHQFRDETGHPLMIVHRDVCPSNILVTLEGLAKLIDFGVAKARTMTIISDKWQTGKTAYMSPEQAKREPVDFRSDIFALGSVLFELLAARPMRLTDDETAPEDVADEPVNWEYLGKGVDADLRAILARMLALKPHERYDDTNAMARDLEEYIYRDGYGPTIQTVEAYMRELCPDLYTRDGGEGSGPEDETVVKLDPDRG